MKDSVAPGSFRELSAISALEQRILDAGPLHLLQDFERTLASEMPAPERRVLSVLRAAIALRLAWLRRHPELLFQTLYNDVYWYDSPETGAFYRVPPGGPRSARAFPWDQPGPVPLHELMERWRAEKERAPAPWLRALRPPAFPLLSGQRALLNLSRAASAIEFSEDARQLHAYQVASQEAWTTTWTPATGDVSEAPRDPLGLFVRSRELVSRSADGRWVAGEERDGDDDDVLCVFDLKSGWMRRKVLELPGLACVGFSRDSRWLGLSRGRELVLLSTEAFDERYALGPFPCVPQAFAVSKDGKHLAVAEPDGTLSLWDLEHPHAARGWLERTDEVSFTATRLFTEPALWQAETGTPIASLPIRSPWGYLEGGPPENYLFVGDERVVNVDALDGMRVWSTADGRPLDAEQRGLEHARHLFDFGPPFFTHLDQVAYSRSGAQLALARRRWGHDPEPRPVVVRVVETETRLVRAELEIPWPEQLALSPDASFLVVANGSDRLLRVIAVENGVNIAVFALHEARVIDVCVSRDGEHVLSIDEQGSVYVWSARTGLPGARVSIDTVHRAAACSVTRSCRRASESAEI